MKVAALIALIALALASFASGEYLKKEVSSIEQKIFAGRCFFFPLLRSQSEADLDLLSSSEEEKRTACQTAGSRNKLSPLAPLAQDVLIAIDRIVEDLVILKSYP